MTYDRTERIRRAAILVASLDEALAEELLRDLAPLEAARVFAELDRLESIDPDEQADVLEEFRRLSRIGAGDDGAVEFAYSAPASAATEPIISAPPESPASSSDGQGDADAATMAELLSHEQPQIIAAALSRLGPERGAEVFAALPPELQAEALDRLSKLAPADEEAVQEVESHLLRRVDERREDRQRAAAGAEFQAQRIVARLAPARRAVLLERIPADGVAAPTRVAAPRNAYQDGGARRDGARPGYQAMSLKAAFDREHSRDDYESDFDAMSDEPYSAATVTLEDLSAEFAALSDEALVAALRVADEQTVQRALAASGESLLDRVARMLPRRQGKKLRRLVQAFGPTKLAELRQAQHELLRVAQEGIAAAA